MIGFVSSRGEGSPAEVRETPEYSTFSPYLPVSGLTERETRPVPVPGEGSPEFPDEDPAPPPVPSESDPPDPGEEP